MKNSKKLLLGLFCGGLILTYSIFFFKNQEKLKAERFNEAEATLVDKAYAELHYKPEHYQLVTKSYHQQDLTLIVPETKDGQPFAAINEQMDALGEQSAEKLKSDKFTKIFITTTPETFQENLTRYTYEQVVYRWNNRKGDWEKEIQALPAETLINHKTQAPLTLGELFYNQKNLSTLNLQIQRDLLTRAKEPQKEVEQILALPQLLAEETNFTYTDGQLSLHYAGKDPYLKVYDLDFSNIAGLIDPTYLLPDDVKEPKAVEKSEPSEKKLVALTFDDGPNNTTTPQILETLAKEKISATFFMLGKQVDTFPQMAKKVAEAGHEIANHSYNHPNLVNLKGAEVRQEINQTQSAIYKATGVLPTYVRPPYGSFDYQTAIAIGQPLINWTVDSLDWKDKNLKNLLARVDKQVSPGGIVLFHDIQATTAKALPKAIASLKKQGYQFVTISQLLQHEASPLTVHYSATDVQDILAK